MHYQEYIVTTVPNTSGGSSASLRVVPLPGQGISTNTKVECSRSMRKQHPQGTLFKISLTLTSREGGTEFLYAHYNSDYEVVSKADAEKFIMKTFK